MMRSLRFVAAAAVLAGLAVPGAAWSAPLHHYSCNLITDKTGDTQGPTPDDTHQLDLTGADIAANDHELTVVIRLASLNDEQPTDVAGRLYDFFFTVGSTGFLAQARLLTGGDDFWAYKADAQEDAGGGGASSYSGIGTMDGIVDTKHQEIRMSAPLSVFTAYAHFDNAPMKDLAAWTYWARGIGTPPGTGPASVGGPSVGISADDAESNKTTYLDWPSCVRIGH